MVAPDNLMDSTVDTSASKGDIPSQTNDSEQSADDKEELKEEVVHRLPSYVPLACCISGYTTLSYDSKQRQSRLSRPVSPLRPSDPSYQQVMYPYEGSKYLFPEPPKSIMQTADGKGIIEVMNGVSGLHSPRHVAGISLAQETRSFTSNISNENSYSSYSSQIYSQTSTATSSFTTSSSTTVNGNLSTSRLLTPTKLTEQLSPSSFIVQRVERLYGPGALAQGFYSPRKATSITQKKTTSTAKDILSANNNNEEETKNESLPVLKLLRPEFRAQLTVASRKLRTTSIPEKLSSSPYEDIKPEEKRKNSSDQVDATALTNNAVVTLQQIENKDGNYFLKILKENVDKLEKLAESAEIELIELQNEEGCGILRAAAGKARLLVAQKLKQFEGLCMKNIKQSEDEDFPTTNEDLAGFWDMVMIQITEVFNTFEKINEMRNNDWKDIELITETTNKRPSTGVQIGARSQAARSALKRTPLSADASKSKGSLSSSLTPSSAAAKARDEARRKMIEERRRAMKEKRNQDVTEVVSGNGDTVFVL